MPAHKSSRTSTMDKVFIVKDLYALVDHLEENLPHIEDEFEKHEMMERIKQATYIRRDVTGSMDGDKNYACAFKHAAGAWRAAEEVWLADGDSDAYLHYEDMTDLFYWVAEKFIGDKLERCARCDDETKDYGDDDWIKRLGEVDVDNQL